jgi:hypothetical protein
MKQAGTSIVNLIAACLLLLLAFQNAAVAMTCSIDLFENEIEQVSGAEKVLENYNNQSASEYASNPFTHSREYLFTQQSFLLLIIIPFIPAWTPSIYTPPPKQNYC